MRRIKNLGFVVHGLLFLISIFLNFKMPSGNAFFMLCTSSFLLWFFVRARKISSTIKSSGLYQDQINLVDSELVQNKKPKSFYDTIESIEFHPMRFWSFVIGVCHLLYGLGEMVKIAESGFPDILDFFDGLFFITKLLLLFSGFVTVVYVVFIKFFTQEK